MENIYADIAARTGGNIYIGVVGPVRTGKSTLIKRIMDEMVIPSLTRVVDRVHEHGMCFELHSCGRIERLVPLMTAGFVVLSLVAIGRQADKVPSLLGEIVRSAFASDRAGQSALGGIGGFLCCLCGVQCCLIGNLVEDEEGLTFCYLLSFCNAEFLQGACYLRIDVDVLAAADCR